MTLLELGYIFVASGAGVGKILALSAEGWSSAMESIVRRIAGAI